VENCPGVGTSQGVLWTSRDTRKNSERSADKPLRVGLRRARNLSRRQQLEANESEASAEDSHRDSRGNSAGSEVAIGSRWQGFLAEIAAPEQSGGGEGSRRPVRALHLIHGGPSSFTHMLMLRPCSLSVCPTIECRNRVDTPGRPETGRMTRQNERRSRRACEAPRGRNEETQRPEAGSRNAASPPSGVAGSCFTLIWSPASTQKTDHHTPGLTSTRECPCTDRYIRVRGPAIPRACPVRNRRPGVPRRNSGRD
jgi:hypothetical protein